MKSRMNSCWIPLLAALLCIPALAADNQTEGDVLIVEEAADEAREPVRSPTRQTDRELPVRGMDMSNVRNVFGAPNREHPAVGEPPITRWDYDGYSVFFEHDKVLHSVVTE